MSWRAFEVHVGPLELEEAEEVFSYLEGLDSAEALGLRIVEYGDDGEPLRVILGKSA